MLRRLEKRILVDLPTKEARQRMFEIMLPEKQPASNKASLELKSDINYSQVAELTQGYSGSDIHLVCKEAAMSVVRKIFVVLEDSTNKNINEMKFQLDTIGTVDVEAAIHATRPSASGFLKNYSDWGAKYGSV